MGNVPYVGKMSRCSLLAQDQITTSRESPPVVAVEDVPRDSDQHSPILRGGSDVPTSSSGEGCL